MEVPFAADIEAQLQQAAAQIGKSPVQLVQDTMSQVLARRAEFIRAVQERIAAADRGEFVEHDAVVEQINRLLEP